MRIGSGRVAGVAAGAGVAGVAGAATGAAGAGVAGVAGVAVEVEVVEAAAGVESFIVSSGFSVLQPANKRTAAAAIKLLNIQHCAFFINFPSTVLTVSKGTMLRLAA